MRRLDGRRPACCGEGPRRTAREDCRCRCGSLLARVVDGSLELKCRRCKRLVSLDLSSLVSDRYIAV